MRGNRQLEHQFRQRLLRRRAVRPEHLGTPGRTQVRAPRGPRDPRGADRDRVEDAADAGLGCVAVLHEPTRHALTALR
ncbi:hypothetical protein RHCRD62_10292 [Rhodococcus sp. RD6.2]|nr:hypothetical protein RHCRD62_10292 [Rhodococcus sp. RD6.2]